MCQLICPNSWTNGVFFFMWKSNLTLSINCPQWKFRTTTRYDYICIQSKKYVRVSDLCESSSSTLINLSFRSIIAMYSLLITLFQLKHSKSMVFTQDFVVAWHQRIAKKIKHRICSVFIANNTFKVFFIQYVNYKIIFWRVIENNEIVKVFPYASKIWKHIRHF